jgi:hypothetical protein
MTDLQAGSVTIGDLYRELVGMRSDLSRVLAHQEATDLINRSSEQIHADHEARLRGLEKFRYTLAGLALVGGAAAGAVGAWVGYVLGHH